MTKQTNRQTPRNHIGNGVDHDVMERRKKKEKEKKILAFLL